MMDLHGDSSTSEFQYLLEVWKRYMLIRGLTPEEREVFLKRVGTGCHFVPKARILELLADAGFGDVIQFSRGLKGGSPGRREQPFTTASGRSRAKARPCLPPTLSYPVMTHRLRPQPGDERRSKAIEGDEQLTIAPHRPASSSIAGWGVC